MSLILFATLRITTGIVQLNGTFVVLDFDDGPRPPKADAADSVRNHPLTDPGSSASGDGGDRPNVTLDRNLNLVINGMRGPVIDRLTAQVGRFNRLPKQEKSEQLVGGILRYAPYAMILLLPAYAGLQQLSYLGRSRRYPQRPARYAGHLIFAAHLHSFIFLLCAVAIAVPSVLLRWLIATWIVFYVVRSTRSIYGGPVAGVVARVLGVTIVYAFLVLLATIALVCAAILLR
jgi:hypothetical protein